MSTVIKNPNSKTRSWLSMSISNLTRNDWSVFHSEMINCCLWGVILFIIYLLFHNKPYLYTNPSSMNDPWLKYISLWPYDIRYLYIILSYIYSSSPFILCCLYYEIVEKYKLFQSYLIRTSNDKYPNKILVKDTISYVLRLFLLYIPLLSFFTFNIDNNFEPIPNIWIISYKFFLGIYLFDILFYFLHAMFHYPFLYKYHKLHHEYKVSISWAAVYSSWAEFFVVNIPATVIPIAVFKFHPVTVLLYYAYRNLETTVSHSGYDLPFYISPLFIFKHIPGHYLQERLHDFHHSHNDGCYGFYFIDAVFGTNEKFRKHMFQKKNK